MCKLDFFSSSYSIAAWSLTKGVSGVLKVTSPTFDQMADTFQPIWIQLQGFLPFHLLFQLHCHLMSDQILTQTSQPPVKTRWLDQRQGDLIQEQAPPVQQPSKAATPTQPTLKGPSNVRSSFEVGSSSAPGGSSPPQPTHDVASLRLARFLAQQDSDPLPRGKWISIGEGSLGGAGPSISELKEEITDEEDLSPC